MKRPWIPIAMVLLVLLLVTVIAGSVIRSRLVAAEAVLDPLMTVDVVAGPDEVSVNGLPSPLCDGGVDVVAVIDEFRAASQADEVSDDDVIFTDATFDSFVLVSAISRVSAGDHQLLLRARSSDDGWCLDEAVFTSEE